MAFKRKATRVPRRRYVKRRKTMGCRRRPVKKAEGKLASVRKSYSSTWVFGTATTNDFWRYYTFTAADINNFAEFANVFDEYRVNAIKVTYRPAYDSVDNLDGAGTLVQPQAYAHYLVDQQSTVNPTGLYSNTTMNTLLENQGVRTKTLNRPFSIYFKPMVSDQLFGGGTATRLMKSPWLKTTETGVQY